MNAQIFSSLPTVLMKFSPKRAKLLCRKSFQSLDKVVFDTKLTESQIKWFFPLFQYCFTLNNEEDSELIFKAYDISLNWILKNNGNFEKKLYLSLFSEILPIFYYIFENQTLEPNYITVISDICPLITNPIYELDSTCYCSANHFLCALMEKISNDEQKIQIIYAAIDILPHYYVDNSYYMQQIEKMRNIVKMSSFSFEWENIIRQIIFKFCKELTQQNIEENDKITFLFIMKLSSIEEVLNPLSEYFTNYSNEFISSKKGTLYSFRIPHNLIFSLMSDKFLMEPIDVVLKSINKLLLESDLDENSKWLDFLLNVVTSRSPENFDLSIYTMNLFLIKFPLKAMHHVFILLKKMRENMKLIQNDIKSNWHSLMFNYATALIYLCNKINEIKSNSENIQKDPTSGIVNSINGKQYLYEQKMLKNYLPVFTLKFFNDRYDDTFLICYSLSKTSCIVPLIEEMSSKQSAQAVALFIFYLSEFFPSFFKSVPLCSWFDVFFGALKDTFTEQNLLIYSSLCTNIILPPDLQDQVKANIFKTKHALLMQTLRQTLREEISTTFRLKLEKAIPFSNGPTTLLLKEALTQDMAQAKITIQTILVNLENSGLSLLLNMLKYILNSQPIHLLHTNDINKLTDFTDKRVCHIRAGNSVLSFVEKDSKSFNLIVRNIAGLFAYEIQDCNESNQTQRNILKKTFSFLVQSHAFPPSSQPRISPSTFLFAASQAKLEKENDYGKLAFIPANEINALDSIIRSPYVDIIIYDVGLNVNDILNNRAPRSQNSNEMLNNIGIKSDHIMNSEGAEIKVDKDSNVRIVRTKLIDTYFIHFSDSLLKEATTYITPKFAIFFCEKWPLAVDINKIGVSILFIVRKVDCFYSLEVVSAAKLYGLVATKLLLPKNELGDIITLYIHSYFFENDNNIFIQQIQLRWNFISSIKQKYHSTTTNLLQNFFL